MTADPHNLEALDRLLGEAQHRAEAAQAVPGDPEARAALLAALTRARTRLAGARPEAFVIALAGGTGTGKSTLINALAGAAIAETGQRRPITSRINVYHHHELPRGGLHELLARDASFVTHDRDALRNKVLVDTPDLDSFVREHREVTRRLMQATGLVLYVVTAEKYLNAEILDVMRDEGRFSACAVVLNKIDQLPGEELERVSADLRARMASLGLGQARLFRVCARQWSEASEPAAGRAADEFAALRDYLERELRASDLARLRAGQQLAALEHVRGAIEAAAPAGLPERLAEWSHGAGALTARAADVLTERLAGPLRLAHLELAPLAAIAQHQGYWGPYRAWLALSDFIRFGLTGLARRFVAGAPSGGGREIEALLGSESGQALTHALGELRATLQDGLWRAGLNLEPWRATPAGLEPATLTAELAEELRARYAVARPEFAGAPAAGGPSRLARWWTAAVVHLTSALGAVIFLGLVGWGLWQIVMTTLNAEFNGFGVLAHVATVIAMLFALLQIASDLALAGGRRRGRRLGVRALHELLRRRSGPWVESYRHTMEREWHALREPLESLAAWTEPGSPGQEQP